MNKPNPQGPQTYQASRRKTFNSLLRHLLRKEFPGTFGPAVAQLFADKVEELHLRCHPPLSRVKAGQVLWLAVAADERPSRHKRIEDTSLVPVVLDLVTSADVDQAAIPGTRFDTRRAKIVRLFQQAHQQGGVLTHADVSLLLHLEATTISQIVLEHEQQTQTVLPRRGTLHDMGRSISHKVVICRKRLVENKPTSQVAEETFHCPEEVEYYVRCCRSVQCCRDSGMTIDEIAFVTEYSPFLVREYLELLDELKLSPAPKCQ
jgi:hypothetical protein